MILPGRRALLAAALLAVLLVAAVIEHLVVLAVILGDLALLAACLYEGGRLRRLPIEVSSSQWPHAQVGRTETLSYRIANRSRKPVIVRLRQNWPAGIEGVESEAELGVGAGEVVRLALRATPRLRGRMPIDPVEFDIRFGSDWARWRRTSDAGELKVFPSLAGMSEYEALRRHHATSFGGLHRQRMLGSGREFDQLRDYVPDDEFRDVNWKATARHNRPITNVYQAERSRDVLLCLDCGRMMGNPIGNRTTLDCAIDASIMLAHVAMRQGDRVGLVLFRDVVHRFIKPAAAMTAVNRIIEELVEARAEGVFPSYAALLTALRSNQTRRGLVLLFTDLNDPQLAANLAEVLPATSRRHLIVVISLRDPLLDRVAAGPARERRDVYQVLAARQLATERATRTRELQRMGATVIEADADSLTVKLLNAYLSIRARQLL